MEWKVTNALNRDVERQQLNKILAEIKAAIATAGASTPVSTSTNTINTVTRYAVARFTFTLDGAVTGSALVDGTGDVTLTTTLADDTFVEEAPIDNQYYSRWNGEWKLSPKGMASPDGFGFLVQIEEFSEKVLTVRSLEGVVDEISVADGDAVAANPVIGLVDTPVVPGSYTHATLTVDAKGRITAASSTDDYLLKVLAGDTTVDANGHEMTFNARLLFPATNTAPATTGDQTINKPSGTVNFSAAATSLVVTNSFCTVDSIVFAVVMTDDTTAVIKNVVPASGSFTIKLNAAATSETRVGFWIINK